MFDKYHELKERFVKLYKDSKGFPKGCLDYSLDKAYDQIPQLFKDKYNDVAKCFKPNMSLDKSSNCIQDNMKKYYNYKEALIYLWKREAIAIRKCTRKCKFEDKECLYKCINTAYDRILTDLGKKKK